MILHKGKIEGRIAVPRALGVDDHGPTWTAEDIFRTEVAVDQSALRTARRLNQFT